MYRTLLMPLHGWQNPQSDWHGEINVPDNNAVRSQFDPDSWMFKGAAFLWQANQTGLLDPDSITHTFASYRDKMKAGRVLMSQVNWDTGSYRDAMLAAGYPEKGHMPIYPEDSHTMWFWGAQPNGLLGGWFVSAKCKAPERAMAFINWLNSYDGFRPSGARRSFPWHGPPWATASPCSHARSSATSSCTRQCLCGRPSTDSLP